MASDKYPMVVRGEASETDSEDENFANTSYTHGCKVAGEAPETDSDEEAERGSVHGSAVPSVCANEAAGMGHPKAAHVPPNAPVPVRQRGLCLTLLQQKLLENNARLSTDITDMMKELHQHCAKQVHMAKTYLSNSQEAIIHTSHNIRLIVEDLKTVSEKMDIVTNCNLLPDINISVS